MSKLFKRFSGITLGLALCFGFSFSCSNKQSSNQMARAAKPGDTVSFVYTTSSNKKLSTTYGANTITDDDGKLSISCTTKKESGNGVIQNSYNTSFGGQQMTTNKDNNTTVSFTFGNPWFGNDENYADYTQINSVTFTAVAGSSTSYNVTCTIDGVAATGDHTGFNNSKTTCTFTPAENHNFGEIVITVSLGSGSKGWYLDNFGINAAVPGNAPTLVSSISLVSEYYDIVDDVITIEKGDGGGSNSDELTAVISPDDAEDKTVTWSSNNESVAQVDNGGYVLVDTSAVGQATITATANDGSGVSKSVTYSVVDSSAAEYDIFTSVTNGSSSGAEKITEGTTATVTIAANNGYKLPSSVSVSGADLDSYDASAGTIVISNPTGAVTISATCPALETYNISVNATNCTYSGDTTIVEKGNATITFVGDAGYALPATVTSLSGATETSWDSSTGVLVISNPTGAVNISMTAATFTNTPNFVAGKYYIKCENNYFTGTVSKGVGGSTTTKPSNSDNAKFTFTLVGNDAWTIKNDAGYYLGIINDAKGVTLTTTQSTLEIESGSTTGTYKIKSKDNNRYFSQYNCTPDFRTIGANQSGRTYDLTMESAKDVSGFSVITSANVNKNVLKDTTFDYAAARAAGFEARITYSDGTYDDVTNYATWSLDTSEVGTNKTLTVSYGEYSEEFNDMVIYVATIDYLVIDSSDAKTTGYYVGDSLNTDGIEVTGYDADNNPYLIATNKVTFSPTTLNDAGTQVITVTFVNEDSSEATGTYSVAVVEFEGYSKVTSLSELDAGDRYIIGSPNNGALMGAYKSDKNLMESITEGVSFSPNKNKLSYSLPSDVTVITLLGKGENQYYLYNEDNSTYLKLSTSNNEIYEVSDMSNATPLVASFSGEQIHLSIESSSRGLGYNSGAPRFTSYQGAQYFNIALYKVGSSSIKTTVDGFANSYLKMNNSDYDGDISTPNCEANYNEMKDAYAVLLNDAEKNVLQYSDDYADARARLNAWATANGETFTYGNASPFESLRRTGVTGDILSPEDDSSLIILFIICTLGAGALSAFYLMKKKKRA